MADMTIRRRELLKITSALVAAVLAGIRPHFGLALTPRFRAVYLLSPTYDDTGEPCGGCSACNACIQHAANKLFATEDVIRAHPNCDCQVITRMVPLGTWVALFGNPKNPRTLVRDRRKLPQRFSLQIPVNS